MFSTSRAQNISALSHTKQLVNLHAQSKTPFPLLPFPEGCFPKPLALEANPKLPTEVLREHTALRSGHPGRRLQSTASKAPRLPKPTCSVRMPPELPFWSSPLLASRPRITSFTGFKNYCAWKHSRLHLSACSTQLPAGMGAQPAIPAWQFKNTSGT